MGLLADTTLAAGGEVIGVITEGLVAKGVSHESVSDLRVVSTMHERKAMMADLADGFVMMVGGYGTLEEFFEAVTWAQLGLHDKPCAIFDPSGFYRPLLELLDKMVVDQLVRQEHRAIVLSATTPSALLHALINWQPTSVEKWIDRQEL